MIKPSRWATALASRAWPGLAIFDAGVDELDAVDTIRGVFRVGNEVVGCAREKDDVAGLGQRVEGLKRNEVDGGAVVEHKFEAVLAIDESFAGLSTLLPGLPALIVGANESGKADEEPKKLA